MADEDWLDQSQHRQRRSTGTHVEFVGSILNSLGGLHSVCHHASHCYAHAQELAASDYITKKHPPTQQNQNRLGMAKNLIGTQICGEPASKYLMLGTNL